ncbi:hypothetical protein HELRODRAFT_63599 [Helobdella robusta]|uniref:Potassium channel domain-containing protein n=1 Tax=Helobdella robusta TaxID=6412 RepID=T1FXI0_HELRO|nr:hypothetical protein HELRODRAFT_63599 [Helobdella robusta]ESO12042.1 hypothetical protein HELRODRAFT_63599 [Helobdella robusta]
MESSVKDGTKAALKFICPKLLLIVMVCMYAIAGGFIFKHLESTNEKQECVEKQNKYMPVENETVRQMWAIINNYDSPGDVNSATLAFQKQLSGFRDSILSIAYNGTNCSMIGLPNGTDYQWSLPAAILFSTTVFTTVGYGNIAPKTMWGRLVCIAYALLGIPLMLLTLANIGEIMANIFRYTYLNVCCCGVVKWCKKPSTTTSYSNLRDDNQNTMKPRISYNNNVVDDDDDEELEKISVPIVVTLFLIASYVFLGALLFAVWIPLEWMDAAYFSFITFSTIGFGDIVPSTTDLNDTSGQLKMVGTALYMVTGMAILSMAFNLMQEEVVDKINWFENQFRMLKEKENIKEMKNK